MSTLRERLGRLVKTSGAASGSPAARAPSERGEAEEAADAAGGSAAKFPQTGSVAAEYKAAAASDCSPGEDVSLGPGWDRLGAGAHRNDWGMFVMRRRVYPAAHRHGAYRLKELCGAAEPLSALASAGGSAKRGGAGQRRGGSITMPPALSERPESAAVCHERLLFLDTETTGLGVGAGNVPFMVGIGFYERESFVVEQLFIRNPAEEAAMLEHLRLRLEERDILVSYNGKSFDWPILKNRFILNRQPEAADPIHFDFLYPSRSLWRNTLPSCRLSSVERERLGLSRIDDVPGSLAPALYFQYLAENDPALVAGVFEHNEKDVLTLACLAVHFARLLAGGLPLKRMEPEELYRLALWLDKLGRAEAAEDAIGELLARDAEEAADYWLPAASFFKRRGRHQSAALLWERFVELKRSRTASLEPYVELAMYYEHRVRDYDRALFYAEQAMERARSRLAAVRKAASSSGEYEALRKRVERLRLKREAGLRKRGEGKAARAQGAIRGREDARTGEPGGVWQQTLL